MLKFSFIDFEIVFYLKHKIKEPTLKNNNLLVTSIFEAMCPLIQVNPSTIYDQVTVFFYQKAIYLVGCATQIS